jgi:hypothetical protein
MDTVSWPGSSTTSLEYGGDYRIESLELAATRGQSRALVEIRAGRHELLSSRILKRIQIHGA